MLRCKRSLVESFPFLARSIIAASRIAAAFSRSARRNATFASNMAFFSDFSLV
jgi:hypothetical protein